MTLIGEVHTCSQDLIVFNLDASFMKCISSLLCILCDLSVQSNNAEINQFDFKKF